MTNPKAVQLAKYIAEDFASILIEQEQNVVTLEDNTGERFIVTVEAIFTPATEIRPLPGDDNAVPME
jgi:hypothetical protein